MQGEVEVDVGNGEEDDENDEIEAAGGLEDNAETLKDEVNDDSGQDEDSEAEG